MTGVGFATCTMQQLCTKTMHDGGYILIRSCKSVNVQKNYSIIAYLRIMSDEGSGVGYCSCVFMIFTFQQNKHTFSLESEREKYGQKRRYYDGGKERQRDFVL